MAFPTYKPRQHIGPQRELPIGLSTTHDEAGFPVVMAAMQDDDAVVVKPLSYHEVQAMYQQLGEILNSWPRAQLRRAA